MIEDDDVPNCFGDESEHDPEHDRHCKVCDIRDACGAEVRAARKKRIRDRALGRASSTISTSLPARDSTGISRRRSESGELNTRGNVPVMRRDVSFWASLGHNTVLETMGAILKEFWYSVNQIPRLEYRSPWEHLYEDKKPNNEDK